MGALKFKFQTIFLPALKSKHQISLHQTESEQPEYDFSNIQQSHFQNIEPFKEGEMKPHVFISMASEAKYFSGSLLKGEMLMSRESSLADLFFSAKTN